MSYSYAVNLASCPAPILLSTQKLSSGASPSGMTPYAMSETSTIVAHLNQGAVQEENAYRYGGSMFACVLSGLALSAPGLLVLDISAGIANLGYPAEHAAGSLSIPSGSTRYIWLDNAGAFRQTSTTTPPTSLACYLGKVTTDGTHVTDMDLSGVIYWTGMATTRTADSGAPGGTTAGGILLCKTAGGVYLWDSFSAWKTL